MSGIGDNPVIGHLLGRLGSCWHPMSHAWRLTLNIGRVLPLVASIHPGSCLVIHLTWDWSPHWARRPLEDPAS